MKKYLLVFAFILFPTFALAQEEEVDLQGLSEEQVVELKEKAAEMRTGNKVSDPVEQAETDSTYVLTAVKQMADELGYETTEDFLRSETGEKMWNLFWIYHAHEAGFNLLAAFAMTVIGIPIWIWAFYTLVVSEGKEVHERKDGSMITVHKRWSKSATGDASLTLWLTAAVYFILLLVLILTA